MKDTHQARLIFDAQGGFTLQLSRDGAMWAHHWSDPGPRRRVDDVLHGTQAAKNISHWLHSLTTLGGWAGHEEEAATCDHTRWPGGFVLVDIERRDTLTSLAERLHNLPLFHGAPCPPGWSYLVVALLKEHEFIEACKRSDVVATDRIILTPGRGGATHRYGADQTSSEEI